MTKPNSSPSSVVHYTSLEVIYKILNNALTSSDDSITFFLSQLTMMNDAGEGNYFLNRFYTDSIKKQNLKQEWDSTFYPENNPFVFSTIATNIVTKHDGSLPMWKMYGDNCKGGFIKFNYNKLKKFCKDNNFILNRCNYLTTSEVDNIVKQYNKELDRQSDHVIIFKQIMSESCFIKKPCWEYENEYRIAIICSRDKIKVRNTARGLIEYIELQLPIYLIEEICIGPLCEKDATEHALNLLKYKLCTGDTCPNLENKVHFKIKKSSIPIR